MGVQRALKIGAIEVVKEWQVRRGNSKTRAAVSRRDFARAKQELVVRMRNSLNARRNSEDRHEMVCRRKHGQKVKRGVGIPTIVRMLYI